MKGESVKVYRRERVDIDALGEPQYIWSSELVENVLVRPLQPQERQEDTERPDRIRLRYTLAFPKTYEGDLSYCKIALIDRGMTFEDALDVAGYPDRLRPSPTAWNMLVNVGRIDG